VEVPTYASIFPTASLRFEIRVTSSIQGVFRGCPQTGSVRESYDVGKLAISLVYEN
jgi:hypothetical protein